MERVRFDSKLHSRECIKVVQQTGAVLIHCYFTEETGEDIAAETTASGMRTVDEQQQRVRQQFETRNYHYPAETPARICHFGDRLTRFIGRSVPGWEPNDAAVQRYSPEQIVGIDPHRDYARDKLLVAVASLTGEADFYIELDGSEGPLWSRQRLVPGDLLLMRAPGLTGAEEDRPRHRIDPPQDGVRVSLALRHNDRLESQSDGEHHGDDSGYE